MNQMTFMGSQKVGNINTVVTFLRNTGRLSDKTIGPQDIVDGNEARILGLVFNLIQNFAIEMINRRSDRMLARAACARV